MLLYSTVCTMCIMTIPRCPDRIHRGVTFVRFANSTLITSFLKLPFLLSSSKAPVLRVNNNNVNFSIDVLYFVPENLKKVQESC
jgi:hypothetical protein